ncbi:MAG: hypothetical protein KBT47_00075, partial [Armatimonadetes bacterium]|nr:hypothetical protein [Candidatus Hippobium faecium]
MRDKKFSPTPFWIMNDKLDKEERCRQADFLMSKGFGGAFFHSSAGLRTEYLSEEWFDCIREAMGVIKKHNGYVWIYDEDTWPSGNAGGKVAGKRENNRAAFIRAEFVPAGDTPNKVSVGEDNSGKYRDMEFLCAYVLKGRENHPPVYNPEENFIESKNEIESFEIISEEEAWKRTDTERIVVRKEYSTKIPWWGGESYSNILEEQAVSDFIEETHEKYKKEFGEEFGKTIPGIYTDEPQVPTGYNTIAWWDGFPETYKEKYGVSLWEDLPYMFFNHKKAYKARLRINRTILDRFVQNYDKRLYDWCEKNSLSLTGHYNCEDTFSGQIKNQYGSVMAHYRYNHIPGIDHLARQVEGLYGNEFCTYLSAIQAVSAAGQLGKKRIMDEIWGVFRHTGSFKDYKWIGDHDTALGINFLVTHFANYSERGRRKRMYPPVYNYQEPFIHSIEPLVSYYSNLCDILSQGESLCDILVLNTIESAVALNKRGFLPEKGEPETDKWSYHNNLPSDINRENYTDVERLDKALRKTVKAVTDLGYVCGIGDEGYIADLGKCENTGFAIGEKTYNFVIIPPFFTMRKTTFDLLEKYAEKGGKILFLGRIGELIDGETGERKPEELLKYENVFAYPISKIQTEQGIDRFFTAVYSLRGRDGKALEKTLANVRKTEKGLYFFITNRDNNFTKDYTLKVKGYDSIYKIDPVDMKYFKTSPIKIKGKEKELSYDFSLGECGSLLLYVTDEKTDCPEEKAGFVPREIIPLENPKITLSEDNICVCDRIEYSLDGGKTFSCDTEANVRQITAKHFGTENALAWQAYVCDRKGIFEGLGGEVVLRYRAESLTEFDCNIVFENLNGGYVTQITDKGEKLLDFSLPWKFDHTFRTAKCRIEKGINIFEHRFNYDYKSEIEKIYITGSFGCEIKSGTPLIVPRKTVDFGSVIGQGLPFYCGCINYAFDTVIDSDRAVLRLK